MTFKMKTAVILSLFINLCLCKPSTNEDIPEQTKKSLQAKPDSVPIALLLLVPSNLHQFREDEEDTEIDNEDFSFIEDHLVNLLLRDPEVSFREDHVQTRFQRENPLLTTKGPLIREGDEEVFVKEEPLELNKDSAINMTPHLRENNEILKASFLSEVPFSSYEDAINALSQEEKEFKLVPEDTLPPSEEVAINLRADDEGSFLAEINPISDDHLIERSYTDYAATYTPTAHKPVEQVVPTYPNQPENAIPILLTCAPKVERGQIAKVVSSYWSQDQSFKARDDHVKNSANFETSDVDFKDSDVLDLNSPASSITIDRSRRNTSPETGVAHYKVSEDYPETFKGNHHLVSADYPQPNMVRITTYT